MPVVEQDKFVKPEDFVPEGLKHVNGFKITAYQMVDREGKLITGKLKREIRHGISALPWGGRIWFTATCYENGEGHTKEETLEHGLDWKVEWHLVDPDGNEYISKPGNAKDGGEREDVGTLRKGLEVGWSSWFNAMSYNFVVRPSEDLFGAKFKVWAVIIDDENRVMKSNEIEIAVN